MKPGYKQTEVGVIPEGWDAASIGDMAKVEGGFAFSSKKFLPSGQYQVVKMSNLYGGALDLDRSASFLDELSILEQPFLLRENDILITLTGTVGKRDYGYSHRISHERNLLLNQRVGRLTVRGPSNPDYVAYQVRMPCFLNQFFDVAKGGTGNQANVGTRDIEAIRIPVPPPPEQRAIAEALSDVDALLGGLDRLIAKKRDLKQAAMQQLLTSQTRLPGFHGEWKVAKLEELVAKATGVWGAQSLGDNHTRYADIIRAGDISPDGELTAAAPRYLSEAEFSKARCQLDDLVITTSGNGLGKVWWCDGRANVAASNFVRVLRPHRTKANGRFLSYVLKSGEAIRQLREHTATSAYPNLRPTFFSTSWISLPLIPEQTAIAAVLTDMDAELAALEQRRAKTRALKQGMMQELLTGRTRLV